MECSSLNSLTVPVDVFRLHAPNMPPPPFFRIPKLGNRFLLELRSLRDNFFEDEGAWELIFCGTGRLGNQFLPGLVGLGTRLFCDSKAWK